MITVGTISMREETFQAMLTDVVHSLKMHGFQNIIIAIGVGAIALGAMLSWYSRQRMMKKMTASMPMGMMGGMPNAGAGGMPGGMPPGMAAMMGHAPGTPPAPAVKVRCRACSSLEPEAAKFCSSCGKAMA